MSLSTLWGNTFGGLQKIGKALMLPVSVLPVAGILLGVGASIAKNASTPWLVEIGRIMQASGDSIFAILPLIFAIGVVLGFTKNDGVAAMAATVGYFVLLAALGVIGLIFIHWTAPAEPLRIVDAGGKAVHVEYDTARAALPVSGQGRANPGEAQGRRGQGRRPDLRRRQRPLRTPGRPG